MSDSEQSTIGAGRGASRGSSKPTKPGPKRPRGALVEGLAEALGPPSRSVRSVSVCGVCGGCVIHEDGVIDPDNVHLECFARRRRGRRARVRAAAARRAVRPPVQLRLAYQLAFPWGDES